MPDPGSPLADDDGFVRLRGLHLLTGWIGGLLPVRPVPPSDADPRRVLESLMLPALERERCFVTFSGGRDSSLVLALATAVARRAGLADPVPITRVYPQHPDREEEDCQQTVVEALRLREWIRVPVCDQQDLLGPWSGPRLARYGLLFPVGAHAGSVLYEHAAGGTIISGEGGDEVLGASRAAVLRAAVRRVRPLRRTLPIGALVCSPPTIRRRYAARQLVGSLPWLPSALAAEATAPLAAEEAGDPFWWKAAKLRLLRRAGVTAGLENLSLLAAEHDITLEHPLLDPRFVASVAAAGGRWGWEDRNALLQRLFGDLLPADVLARRSKASFNRAAVGENTLHFARTWSGAGIDPRIDVERLRSAWLSDLPPASSLPLLQAAWLHAQGLPDTGGLVTSAA